MGEKSWNAAWLGGNQRETEKEWSGCRKVAETHAGALPRSWEPHSFQHLRQYPRTEPLPVRKNWLLWQLFLAYKAELFSPSVGEIWMQNDEYNCHPAFRNLGNSWKRWRTLRKAIVEICCWLEWGTSLIYNNFAFPEVLCLRLYEK